MGYNYKKINEHPWKYGSKLSVPELVKLLKHLSEHYHNSDESLIEDDAYDILKDILEEKDPNNKFLKSVGAPVENISNKCKLKYYAGSLDKKKPTTNDIDKWFTKYTDNKIISHKLDGISAILTNSDKNKLSLCTRGDGFIGQNIDFLLEYIFSKTYIKELPDGPWCIRGELIMSKKNFDILKNKIETKNKKAIKNGRNLVAGLINSKTMDSRRILIAKNTDFIAYNVFEPKLTPIKQFKWMEKNNFDVVKHKIFSSDKELTVQNLIDELDTAKKISKYEIDGLVVTNDGKYKLVEGKNPKYSFAFKQLSKHEFADVKVLKVDWRASIDGYLKPRIFVETVHLAGVDIGRATAFNAKFIFDNKIGKKSIVRLVRSGDVIPHILKVIKRTKTSEPTGEWEWNESGVDIIGTDEKYKKQILIKQITNFFKVLSVKNLGKGIITKFVKAGYDSVKKILTMKVEQIANIEGMGEKSGKKIIKNITGCLEELTLEQLMTASHSFGRGFGEKKFSLVLKKYPNVLKMDTEGLVKKIMSIEGYDILTAKRFVKNLSTFKTFIASLKNIIDVNTISNKKPTVNFDNSFNNEVVVLTGFRNKILKKFIEERGGRMATTISGKTTLLITKDAESSDSKIKKAKNVGVKIITYDEFVHKYKLPIDV